MGTADGNLGLRLTCSAGLGNDAVVAADGQAFAG